MRFVFHHIPKCGGTSLHEAAETAGFQPVRAQDREHDTVEDVRGLSDWLSSHFLFADYRPGPNDVYFTWLRNPIDLLYSGYFYWRVKEVIGFEFPPPMVEFMRRTDQFEDARHYADFVLSERAEHVFPRGLYDLPWERFHFIGRTDRMAESVQAFNIRFGTALEPQHVNGTGRDRIEYRRNELAEFLAPETAAFLRWAPEWV